MNSKENSVSEEILGNWMFMAFLYIKMHCYINRCQRNILDNL